MKCKLRALPKSRSETVRDDIRTFFEERKPYDFLQLCYYQVGKHQDAANAAFTNLAVNAEVREKKCKLAKKRDWQFFQAEVMRENLNYYLALPSVVKGDVVDLEAKVQKTFIHDNNRALKLILTHLKKGLDKAILGWTDGLC